MERDPRLAPSSHRANFTATSYRRVLILASFFEPLGVLRRNGMACPQWRSRTEAGKRGSKQQSFR